MSSEKQHPNPPASKTATTYVFPNPDLLAADSSGESTATSSATTAPTARTAAAAILVGTSTTTTTGAGAGRGKMESHQLHHGDSQDRSRDVADFRKELKQQQASHPQHFQIKLPLARSASASGSSTRAAANIADGNGNNNNNSASGNNNNNSSSSKRPQPADSQTSSQTTVSAHGSSGGDQVQFSGVTGQTMKYPIRSVLKGHNRSASHGGVMGQRTEHSIPPSSVHGTASAMQVIQPLTSAMKKGHVRAASHGSKTDFTLPPDHMERERPATGPPTWDIGYKKGHSRQASRTESIYTLRSHRGSARRSRFLFWKSSPIPEGPKTRTIVPNHCFPPNTPPDQHPNGKYPSNLIRTTKYTLISFLPKNLFEQFHRFANLYFISIVLLNWIPQLSVFGKEIAMLPVMFVLGVTAIKDLFEDRRRHNSDKRVNSATCRVYNSEANRYIKVKCKNMRVGDIVHVGCNEMIPADILVLNTSDPLGLCYIETMNLDGENNLKQREVVRGFEKMQSTFEPSLFKSNLEVSPPTTKIYHFTGNMIHQNGKSVPLTKENLLLRDCTLKNTDYIVGLVVYAGRETKAMLNNGGPRHKRTGLEKLMNNEVMWCVVILAVMCVVGATGSAFWLSRFSDNDVPFAIPKEDFNIALDAFLSFLAFIILLQIMIPLSLYVTLELCKLMQIFHIHWDRELYDEETGKRIECRAMNIPEDLGQIQYVFSDKTGTLTENKMIFRKCTIGGIDYNHALHPDEMHQSPSLVPAPLVINPALNELLSQISVNLSVNSGNTDIQFLSKEAQYTHDFFMILAVCNTVVVAKYPHHDMMNASGTICPTNNEPSSLNPRLSPIRESIDSISSNMQDHQSPMLVDLQSGDSEVDSSTTSQDTANAVEEMLPTSYSNPSNTGNSFLKPSRRPRILSLLPSRPLSPISSSNETTPTESPAQRPRFLQIPSKLRLNRSLATNNNQTPGTGTATPSPSELRPIFEAESPDELALVEAAYAYQCKLFKRSPKVVRVAMPSEGLVEYEVLHSFPFDSVRKRMSIVLRHPNSNQIILYCKGADTTVLSRLKPPHDRVQSEILDKTQAHMNSYARDGLRTLVMAKRILSEIEYNSWKTKLQIAENDIHNRENKLLECYDLLERNLEIVGATGIEDRLQDGVPETIQNLRSAGIVVWVLTGDKQETAINIAHSCKLFTPSMDIIKLNARSKEAAENTIKFYTQEIERLRVNQTRMTDEQEDSTQLSQNHVDVEHVENPRLKHRERALVIDGKTLTYVLDQRNSNLLLPFLNLTQQCSSVLCCRSTPLQKAYIVSSVKDKLKKRTLAIGDGANDVSMIQRADIGVGISGKEGMQAVMASDFAISKFRFLERLLLVHGHWCYDRLARMILYFFYKNAAFVFVIFWYQLMNGWSGSVMIDQMYLMVFNLFFTALPPMAIGIYDQDAPAKVLKSVPQLYRQGRLQKVHQAHSFWLNMLDALYQSVVIFFMAFGAYQGSEVGLLEFGTTIVVSCMFTMLAHMAIEVKSWTVLHIGSIVFSVVCFYAFAFIYNTVCINCLGFENPYWVIHKMIGTWTHWLTIFVTVALAVLPRATIRTFANAFYPSDVTKALIMKRKNASKTDEELFATWSSSASDNTDSSENVTCVWWKTLNEQEGDGQQASRGIPRISVVES